MNNLIKLLDKNLEYIEHKLIEDTIHIYVKSINQCPCCPYCGTNSNKVHSKYRRTFQDLPIQRLKTIIIIDNRKMFCTNDSCDHCLAQTNIVPKKELKILPPIIFHLIYTHTNMEILCV